MADITIMITNAGRAALVNAANTGTAPVIISHAGISASAVVPSQTTSAIPGEIKRIATLSGDVVADDTIHLVVRDESADQYSLRSFGLYLADGTLFAVYGQATPIMEKSSQSMLLLAVDVRFADINAAALSFGNANFLNPPATTERLGVVELSTSPEAIAGTSPSRVPPEKAIKDAVNAWLDARFGAANSAIWHPANDGAGSGLDADLLDGQQGSWFADVAARLGYTPANRAGDYFTGNIYVAPARTVGVSDNVNYGGVRLDGGDNVRSGVIGFYSPTSVRVGYMGFVPNGGAIAYSNDKNGGHAFVGGQLTRDGSKIWDAANDGAGSGLDADLLDGQQGSWFADIAARLGYMPANKSGEIFSGDIGVDHSGSSVISVNSRNVVITKLAAQADGNIVLYRNVGAGDVPIFGVNNQSGPFAVNMPITRQGNKVWDLGNDGSGSGLDADLLDGFDESNFLRLIGSNLSENGHIRFANGLQLCWGRWISSGSAGGPVAVYFDRPFANEPFAINLTPVVMSTGGVTAWTENNITGSSFNARCSIANIGCRYIAVGLAS